MYCHRTGREMDHGWTIRTSPDTVEAVISSIHAPAECIVVVATTPEARAFIRAIEEAADRIARRDASAFAAAADRARSLP